MPGISLVSAKLTSLVLESFLTGISLTLSCKILRRLYPSSIASYPSDPSPSQGRPPIRAFLVAALLLSCAIVTHWALNVSIAFDALARQTDFSHATRVFGKTSDPRNVVSSLLYTLEIFIADGILVYRCYKISSQSKCTIIFPCLSILGSVVGGIGIAVEFCKLPDGDNLFSPNICTGWISGALMSALFTNLYCTSLIIYHILKSRKNITQVSLSTTGPVLYILVQTVAIYSAVTLLTLVLFLCKSNFQFVTLNATSPIIGIMFFKTMEFVKETPKPVLQAVSPIARSDRDSELAVKCFAPRFTLPVLKLDLSPHHDGDLPTWNAEP